MTGVKLNHPLLIGALGGVLAACMTCGILATGVAMFAPAPTPTPTVVIEPTTTTSPATPTVTPVPTIAIQPTPTIDDGEARYIDSLNAPIDQMVGGLLGIVELLREPQNTPQWRAELRRVTQEVSNAHYAITRLNPPPDWQAFHGRLQDATYQCSLASDMLYTATSDTSYLQLAVGAMQRCNNMIEEVSNELGKRSRTP